jgi:glycosyl transferase family 2
MISESPGTIALPTSEIGRYAMFMVSLAGTHQPPDTNLAITASASVTENINSVIRDLRPQDEWVWILGDDHVWPQNTLTRLLETLDEDAEIDILVPLVVKRNPPWNLVIFRQAGTPDDGLPRWQPFQWEEIPQHGTFEIDAAGSAGMLIRREVLDTLGDPWFRSTGGVYLNEDVTFCADATNKGFHIYATADVTMGHLGIFNVRPHYRNGRWGALTEFTSPEEQYRHLFMPDIEEPHPEAVGGRG